MGCIKVMKLSCGRDPQPLVCPAFAWPVPPTVKMPPPTTRAAAAAGAAAAAAAGLSPEEQLVAAQEGLAGQGSTAAGVQDTSLEASRVEQPPPRTLAQRLLGMLFKPT